MNSYNIIINELIAQKQFLDEKGFAVNTANTYPSPSEITEAIKNISFNLSNSTATEEDVLEGKTFYSQTNDLKTGTLKISSSSELNNYIGCLISGRGQAQVVIPSNITQIRPYAFATYTPDADATVFSCENLTIPSNITAIYQYAFYKANITGTLTVPSSVTEIADRAFYYSKIAECVLSAQLTKKSTNIFGMCSSLKKITVTEPVSILYKENLGGLRSVKEVILPASLTSIESNAFYQSTSPETVRFLGATPPTITTSVLSNIPSSTILVPIDYYYDYYNATNYLASGNDIFGVANFKAGDILPSSVNDMPITWHAEFWDAKYNRDPVTECPADGELMARFVEST